MYHSDIEFQGVFFLASGALFGGISKSLFTTILFVIIYEYYVFYVSRFYPPSVREVDRVLLNAIFFLGWIVGRVLMLGETGFEEIVEYFN